MSRPITRPLKKDALPSAIKPLKPVLLSESPRPSLLAPNIRALSWSPTGSLIATCTSAHIRIWSSERLNVKNSTEIRSGHNGSFSGGPGGSGSAVEQVAFSPTTEHVLGSTGQDGGVRLWDVRVPGGAAGGGKGTQLADCKVGDPALFLTWHPNGQEMLVGTKDDNVHAVDVRRMMDFDSSSNNWAMESTNCTPSANKASSARYYAMCFSNSGREVFATTGDGPVKLLDYPSMSTLHSLPGHSYATYAVQHSPRGDWLAVGGGDSIISLWDTNDWHCAHTLTSHASAVRDISFSFDGAYLVAGSGTDARDGTSGIDIYHADTGDVAHTIDTSNPVTVAAWHPYKYWLAYAGDPGGLKLIGPGSVAV
ncbi:hypothetical protein LTR09_005571 [Extremus antarcticus]|uniref:WD40 repeat-like protein n=1 Tax=Extremus antarcticus TaxID=702011 RepID=A0AAJ0GCB1_9PEZI|nr:hypothetical protein LTR09_005571 [Extremus antarcticus]